MGRAAIVLVVSGETQKPFDFDFEKSRKRTRPETFGTLSPLFQFKQGQTR